MRKPILTIFYQFNPWQATIGGIQTIIRYYIKYAPPEFDIRLVGTGTDPKQRLGHWHDMELEGRKVQFMPLFYVKDDNIRQLLPTSVRYTLALWGKNLSSDFMHFHRLEPTIATRQWAGEKSLFIHNDIHQQINNPSGQNAILWRHFPRLYFALERLLLGQFQQILSCNSDSVEFYRHQYPDWATRIQLVRNTVDNDQFYPLSPTEREQQRQALAERMGLPPKTPFILFAGRLHPQKDPVLLIQSFAHLLQEQAQLKEQPQPHLLVAGEGELMAAVQSEVQALGLHQFVSLLGALPLAELSMLHRVSSAVVLTSAYEGLPLVVLEALASGTPIITANCGETPKFLKPGSGLVCQARTPVAIATAIRQVLAHPEQFPSEVCLDVARPFSVKAVVSQIYEGMLHRWRHNIKTSSNQSPLADLDKTS